MVIGEKRDKLVETAYSQLQCVAAVSSQSPPPESMSLRLQNSWRISKFIICLTVILFGILGTFFFHHIWENIS